MEYLVTHCPTHGLKVAEDEASARVYRALARDYKEYADENGFTGDYYDTDGILVSEWACCSDMTIGTDSDKSRGGFFLCGHANAGLRGPNGECMKGDCR